MSKQKEIQETSEFVPPKTRVEKTVRILKMMTVEPALLVHMTASFLGNLMITDLTQYQACTVNFGFNETYCNTPAGKRVKPVADLVADINVWKQVIDNSFPIVFVLFLGAWSDIYGRKAPILMSIFGYIIRYIGLLLVVYYPQTTAETVGVIASVPISLTGGRTVISMALYSYVSDTTSIRDRTLRTGILTAVRTFGKSAGSALGGVLKKRGYDYTFIFAVGGALDIAAFTWTLFVVRNTRKDSIERSKKMGKIMKDVFNIKNVKESAIAFFRKREGLGRLQLILLVITLVCTMAPMQGEESMLQLFATNSKDIGWDVGDYGYYNTYRMLLAFFGGIVSLGLLVQLLKLDDYMLGVLSCISQIAGSLCYAFADSPLMMYIAPAVDILNGSMIVAVRSMISKVVPRYEIGKVNSFIGTIDSSTPLPSNPIYSKLYRSTKDTFPGAVFVLSAALTIPPLFIFSWFGCYKIQPVSQDMPTGKKDIGEETNDENTGTASKSDGSSSVIVKAV